MSLSNEASTAQPASPPPHVIGRIVTYSPATGRATIRPLFSPIRAPAESPIMPLPNQDSSAQPADDLGLSAILNRVGERVTSIDVTVTVGHCERRLAVYVEPANGPRETRVPSYIVGEKAAEVTKLTD